MKKIKYYLSLTGIYFQILDKNNNLESTTVHDYSVKASVDCFKLNGLKIQKTFSPKWFFVPSLEKLLLLQVFTPPKMVLEGYELSNVSLFSDKIPQKLTLEEVEEYFDSDKGETRWKNPRYKDIKSLYSKVLKSTGGEWKDLEFAPEFLGTLNIENPENLSTMRLSISKDKDFGGTNEQQVDLSSIAHFYELEKMLVPEFALPERPCFLTSKQSYQIVRSWIKSNIDPKQAAVTSDYNFCFAVKKKISIAPYSHSWEVKKANGKPYARPNIQSKKITHKEIDIFEMTNAEDGYKGYTPILGFKGQSLRDLAENIKLFLDELIFFINQEVEQCPNCSGSGHLVKKFTDLNKRHE